MPNIYSIEDVWNESATVFVGIGYNTNAIAFDAGSFLMRLQRGGVTQFSVGANGEVATPGARYLGKKETATAPTTTEFPLSGDWGFHKDTVGGSLSLVFNDGGSIVATVLQP